MSTQQAEAVESSVMHGMVMVEMYSDGNEHGQVNYWLSESSLVDAANLLI